MQTHATGRPTLDSGYYERLFQSSGFAIIICSVEGEVLAWNVAASRLFCGGQGDPGQARLTELLPEADREAVNRHIEECRRSLHPVEFQVRLGGTDAEPIVYAVLVTPVRGDDGALESLAMWFRDISPRVRLARELSKSERMSALGRMSGAVAHHYNNMVGSIQASLDYAINMQTVSAMRKALARTSEAVARTGSITLQLLAFAQADHRAADLSDVTEILMMVVDEQEARLRQRNIALEFDAHPVPVCAARRDAMRIVLGNIIDNAVEAMPTGGTLSITLARRDEQSVAITISDTGGGIADEDMEHLFEPFHTSKGAIALGGGRNPGLGLAVAHGLVRGMGGSITASNVAGRGARFDIVLPLNADGGD